MHTGSLFAFVFLYKQFLYMCMYIHMRVCVCGGMGERHIISYFVQVGS